MMIHETKDTITASYAAAFFRAAERNFHARIIRILGAMGPWRAENKNGIYGRIMATRMLNALSRSVAHTRHSAREAFEKSKTV